MPDITQPDVYLSDITPRDHNLPKDEEDEHEEKNVQ